MKCLYIYTLSYYSAEYKQFIKCKDYTLYLSSIHSFFKNKFSSNVSDITLACLKYCLCDYGSLRNT